MAHAQGSMETWAITFTYQTLQFTYRGIDLEFKCINQEKHVRALNVVTYLCLHKSLHQYRNYKHTGELLFNLFRRIQVNQVDSIFTYITVLIFHVTLMYYN